MPDLNALRKEFAAEIESVVSTADIEQLRVKYLGKKGAVQELLKGLTTLSPEEKKNLGKVVNDLKQFVTDVIGHKKDLLKGDELRKKIAAETIDITLPGKHTPLGCLHPITRTTREIVTIFSNMGFTVEDGPEVETDYNNFEALNIHKDHPARDMQDTFYVTDDTVMRTQTSPVQIRTMMKHKPPLRIIAPGKVYRCDADITHSPMFHQIEGLMVGPDVSFSNLKDILETFIHKCFGPEVPVRFRPSYFPFTEPSAEVDIGCIFCKGKGCRICKNTGWIEILGSGMVNPKVFEMVGYDPNEVSGFAFGVGIERVAMLKYSIDDIRLFYENDLRFLRQF